MNPDFAFEKRPGRIRWRKTLFVPLFTILAVAAALQPVSLAQTTGKYLYTNPDPSAPGGIRGRIANPAKPVVGVFAIPPDEPKNVYKAELSGDGRRDFSFAGLPMGRYDLVVLFDNTVYEGLSLTPEDDTLTAQDRKLIEAIINKSEGYFENKVIHRVAGTTGDGNEARAFCTFYHAKPSTDITGVFYPDPRRSIKLVVLKDVGPGWQIVRTREIHVDFVKKENGIPRHVHTDILSGIRVSDSVKNIGELDLASGGRSAGK